ncbi:MAG: hypothetical protein K2Z81_13485, partial [Cyanobacteria bacterium]|nr:hypothetical protein [Cyanobacteriota bacterium]
EAEKAYKNLTARLSIPNLPKKAANQAHRCLIALKDAWSLLQNHSRTNEYRRARDEDQRTVSLDYKTRPRLGQLCVASGMISMEQLQEAVEVHMETGTPLGEILEEKQFISGAELEGLLLGQDLIDVDNECTDPVGLRLITLNLAIPDMVLIAQMEMRVTEATMMETFLKYRWIEPEIVQFLGL